METKHELMKGKDRKKVTTKKKNKHRWKRRLINFDIHGAFNKSPDFFLYRHLKLSLTLENSLCYCYTSYEMTDQFFMISCSNVQLQQQLEYTLLKPDCHS